jgi:hypothetical protein
MIGHRVVFFAPVTPGGTTCWHLKSDTREEAIDKLLEDAAHMPYQTWENFKRRGYRIYEYTIGEQDEDEHASGDSDNADVFPADIRADNVGGVE